MAGAEVDADVRKLMGNLRQLGNELRELGVSVQSSGDYCQRFCQTLVQYAGKWKISEDPLPLLEVYTVAIQNYSKARPCLTAECENVCFVLDRLALSCTELLLCLPDEVPDTLWEQFQACVQAAHKVLSEYGNPELQMLAVLAKEGGVWKNSVLNNIFSQQPLEQDKVNEFLMQEGPALLEMRIRHLIKGKRFDQATKLAKVCAEHPEIGTKSIFKQIYLTCLCTSSSSETLMEEISAVDCKDALEMICNLESDGEENLALILCTAFLTRQLQQGDLYCAWELTLFWSKLQQRIESSSLTFLECCRQFSMLSKTVYHIFFLIKVIQSEAGEAGLSACIELCVRALRMESNESPSVKTSICKTVSCLLPDYLEVRRACQLTEFLLEPTVEAYYAVETLYNQPDQKYDDENGPIPNSLRCELLLVLKTHWPFDPEFWDWKTLKRHCLALMGEEASIVSSIDELNDSDLFENNESHPEETAMKEHSLNGLPKFYSDVMKVENGSSEKVERKENPKIEKGVVSARFKNWQAYMQYCVLCDREFLGHRIIRHAQTHVKDGNYYCPICAKSFKKKEIFVPHVTFHIKQSCKERLASIKPKRRVGRPPKNLTDFSPADKKIAEIDKQEHRPIKRNSLYGEDFVVFSDSDGSDDEGKDKSYKPEITTQKVDYTEDYNCPVTICTKTFKYFKNLIAHVKGHGNDEEAKQFLKMQSNKVVCQYCRRRFVSVSHLNEHLQIHCGPNPYVCIQLECNASFSTYSELVGHRKEHLLFKAKCMFQNCGRIFTESYLLYDHEAQHYHNSSYTCKFSDCGNIYYSQSELQKHEVGHTAHACVKIETENSSPFQADQLATNRTDRVGQLLQIKAEDELRLESDVYENGFSTDCVPSETAKPKSSMSEDLEEPSTEQQNHLPKNENCVTIKNEKTESTDMAHAVLPETVFKGEDAPIPMLPIETAAGEAAKSVQRFNCKVDGCSRSYTSSRSVSKHIKAAHPEFYEMLKQQRNLAKKQQVRNPPKCQNQEKPSNPLCYPNERISAPTPESTTNTDGAVYQQQVPCVLTVETENVAPSRKKRHTHNKRAKWPAIIKGDKFICSRCYREFTNPKSLGGHLSRRAICKPYDKKESSSIVEQKNGQALYVTEKILSSDVFTPQGHEPPCISDTFLTGETFLQSLEMGDSTEPFAGHELFQSTQENNYNSSIFEPSKTLPVTSLPGTFDSEVIQQTFQPGFEMSAVETSSSNITISQALTTMCSPRSFVAGEDMSLSTEVPPMLDVTSSTAYSSCEPLQQPIESNFCSGTYADNEIHAQNLESSCEPSVFFTNGALPDIDTTHNSSHSEDPRTLDIRIAEVLLGLQNLNLEYDEKPYTSGAPRQTSRSETPVSSMNISTHAPMNSCTSGPNIINQCLTAPQANTSLQLTDTENDKELKVNLIKPFICQESGCVYSAMTKDALTNHYVKVHQYSKEQIMEIKMYQTRFAPFKCHVPNCQKTFTRNSNLRAHYQLVHHVTREELVKLRIKRVYCKKLEGQYKTTDSLPPLQEIIPQSTVNGTQDDKSISLHELDTVTPVPNEVNSEMGLHLPSAHNDKTVLYDQGLSQNGSVLLASLENCSPLSTQLQNTLAQSIGPQDTLVPRAVSQDIPLLLAGPTGDTVEPHSSPTSAEDLLTISPLLTWPQTVLPLPVKPQDISTIPAGLQDMPLLPAQQQCTSPLPTMPQSIPIPGAPAVLPITTGPADVPFMPAEQVAISRILPNTLTILPLTSGSDDVPLLSMSSSSSLPVSVGMLGSSALTVGPPGASPMSLVLPGSSSISVGLPVSTVLPASSAVSVRPSDASSITTGLPGSSPMTAVLPGSSLVTTGLLGSSPVTTALPRSSPVTTMLPRTSPLPLGLPGSPSMTAGLPRSSPVTAGLPGSSITAGVLESLPVTAEMSGPLLVTTGLPESSPVTTGLPGSSPATTVLPGSSPVTTGLPGSSPVTTGLPGSSPVTTGLPGSSPVTTRLPGSSPVTAGLPGSSPVTTGLPGSSPVTTGLPGSTPVTTVLPGSTPVTTGLPGSTPVTTGLPGSSPVTAGLPGSTPVTTGLPGSTPVTTGLPGSTPVTTGLPGSSPVTTGLPGSTAVTTGLPGSTPVTTGLPGSSPVTTGLPGSSPVTTGLPGSSPVTARLPGSSPVTTGLPGSFPVTTGLPGSSPVTARLPGSSPVTAGLPGSSPVTARLPRSSPVTAGLPGSSPVTTGLPGLSPVAARLPGSSPVTAGLPGSSPLTTGLLGTPLSAEPPKVFINPIQKHDAFLHPERPEDVVVQPSEISVQERKCEGNLEQTGGTTTLMKVSGERKCKKSVAKVRAECDSNNFHKPYQCVHKGCSAAFTIQQNLILHYRAVHQSDQQLLHTQLKQEITQSDNIQVKEFQCQIDDCCRIFQGATDLIKHYSELHSLAIDEIGKIMSASEGQFHCDQAHCVSSFTVFWNFIKHLLVAHGVDVDSPQNDADAACFRCDCEGCDRTYATRSNLLRHIFTKHRELHQSHLMRPRRIIPSDQENFPRVITQDGLTDEKSYFESEELSENEDAVNHSKSSECSASDSNNMKSGEIDDKSYNSRKVGKYTFKSKAQALAMCSSKAPKEQYPCMFENCSSVVTSEQCLVKHYRIHHKISSVFVSQYHNYLVICRKLSNVQGTELTDCISSHEERSAEYAVNGDVIWPQDNLSEIEVFSKKLGNDNSFKSSIDELSESLNAEVIEGTGSKSIATEQKEITGEKKFTDAGSYQPSRKRSTIQLDVLGTEEGIQTKKKRSLIEETPEQLLKDDPNQALHQKKGCPPERSLCTHKTHHHKSFDLSTFKPMGFEISFLKFLEESALKQKRKALASKVSSTVNTEKVVDGRLNSSFVTEDDADRLPTKHPVKKDTNSVVLTDYNKQSVTDKLYDQNTEHRTLANFTNPLSLRIFKNIKIIMDKADSNCVELAEKQLQHMHPTVVLSRVKVDFNMLAQVKDIKERLTVKST
ncbi:zinc finger protein 292b [Mobula birostris]|uniref:zinc finger protein 292b n=1 Tax=Mobula birostris TaxID=1983395 RepID=UPI003B288E84